MRFTIKLLLIGLAVCTSFVVAGTIVGAELVYDLDLEYTDSKEVKMASGRNPLMFNFTIEHNGSNPSEDVFIEVVNASGWQYILVASTAHDVYTSTDNITILLQKDEVAPLTVTFTPSATTLNGTHWFGVRAYMIEDTTRNETIEIGIIVPQVASFRLELENPPPNMTYEAIAPSYIYINYILYNTGNGKDRFRLTGDSSRVDDGWTTEFVTNVSETGLTDEMEPDPGMNYPYFLSIRIRLPANTAAHERGNVTISASSLFDQSKEGIPVTVAMVSLQYYRFQVYINGLDQKEGIPGENVTFEVKIVNHGNGPDNFSLTALFDEELNPGFEAFPYPSTITIERNDTATALLVVEVPEDAPKKTYWFTMDIQSESPMLVPVPKSFAVEVSQFFGVELTCEDPYRYTIPGGNMEFEVMVTNTGNGLDSIIIMDIEGVPDGWLTYTQPPEVTLLGGQNATIKTIVIVPSQFEEAPLLAYTLTVPAESTRSDAEDSLDLTIEIEPFWRIDWMYWGEPITNPDRPVAQPGSIRPRPEIDLLDETSATIILSVKNYGNADDKVRLEVVEVENDVEQLEVTVTPIEFDLKASKAQDVTVTMTVPKDGRTGVFNFFLNAHSSDTSLIVRVVPMDLEVIPVYDREDFIALDYIDPPGDDYTFTYTANREAGRVIDSRGRLNRSPAFDITHLGAMLDPSNGTVVVTLTCGEIANEEGALYGIFFVNKSHRQTGPLLRPSIYQRGAFNYSLIDPSLAYLSIWYIEDGFGTTEEISGLEVTSSSNEITFVVPLRELRRMGMDPGSEFGVYAYAQKMKVSDNGDYKARVVWDSAGLGAVNPPAEFTNEPEEGPISPFLAVLAISFVAVVIVAVAFRRRFHR